MSFRLRRGARAELLATVLLFARCTKRELARIAARSPASDARSTAAPDWTLVDPAEMDGEPTRQLSAWLQAARDAGEAMPEAMTLATSTRDGVPSARMVILRGLDRGVVFFTDTESDKGAELTSNPHAAAVLHWLKPEHRQVRVVGSAEPVSAEEADAYWRARPAGARRNAAASHQSRPLRSRVEVEARVAELATRFPDGTDLGRPDRWGGYRVVPTAVEFWQEAADGLHDRVRYRRNGARWTLERLSP